MIIGIGTDIVAVSRMKQLLQKYAHKFAKKILSVEEFVEFQDSNQPEYFLAKRFAAKEALLKALGIGLKKEIFLKMITVSHHASGKPFFKLDVNVQHCFAGCVAYLSISDEREYAVAFVVLESKAGS